MLHSNTTVSSSSLDLDVATLPEASPPAVLHQPVVQASLVAVADHGHLVVQSPDTVGVGDGLTAPTVVEDSTAVVSEVGGLEWVWVSRDVTTLTTRPRCRGLFRVLCHEEPARASKAPY